VRSANEPEVRSLRQLVGATPIVGLVRQIGEVEQELAAAQTRLNHLKRQLAVAMMG